ncbi:MAG: helix-turn-helix transcriptional regulator [Provencibacterium sp.]|nr:helix-turn-helix transcriptional regulator [Provencibacterium sp.]
MKRRSLIVKVLGSYLALLILPVFLFTTFAGYFCNRYIVDTVLEKQQMLAERYVDELNGLVGKFQKIARDMRLKKIFIREYAREIPVVFYDIQDYLIDATSRLDLAAEAFYYTLPDNRTYTSQGVYTSYPPLDSLMQSCTYLKDSCWMNSGEQLHYIAPLEYSANGTLMGAAVFSISRSYFDEQLEYTSLVPETVSSVSFNLQELYCSGREALAKKPDKQYHHVYADPSHGRGFRIDYHIPKRRILENDLYPIQVAVGFAMLMLTSGGLIVFIMVRKNYLPLQRTLLRLLLETSPSEPIESAPALNQAVDQIITLKRELATGNQLLLREHYLYRLIDGSLQKGNIPDKPEEVDLSGPCYVCIFSDEPQEQLEPPAGLSYERIPLAPQSSCLILSGGHSVLEDTLHHLEAELETRQGHSGIGSIAEAPEKIAESFLHARFAYHDAVRRKKTVTSYNGFDEESTEQYPYDLLEALDVACRSGDAQRIDCLSAMIRNFILEQDDRFLGACIFEDYLKSAAYGVEILRMDESGGTALREKYYRLRPAGCRAIADSISEISLLIRERLCEQRRSRAVSFEELKAYLNTHFLDPGFSLKSLAYELGTSSSNLSHLFKKGMGITLTEYIDQLKMECAKKMLADPSNSVSDISRRLGFANPSTFIKKFKASAGTTPGEYRSGSNSFTP